MALNFQTNRGWTAATLAPQTPAPSTVTPGAPINGAPDFLQNAITQLLQTQASGGGGSSQSSLIRQILGDPNGYLLAPALAAGAFKPGGGTGGGGGSLSLAPIQNPLIGQGYNTQANAQAMRAEQQRRASDTVYQLQNKIWDLTMNPQAQSTGGFYGAGYNQGQQLIQLKEQLKAANQSLQSTSQPSGWSSNPPGY